MPTTATDVPVPALDRADVALPLDRSGRIVIVVPDDVALALVTARRIGWRDVPGFGYGESSRFPAGSPVALVIMDLLKIITEAQPDDHDGHDWTDGGYARVHRSIYAPIVGRSGWDSSARTWRGGYHASAHLIVGGAAHVDHAGAAYFAG